MAKPVTQQLREIIDASGITRYAVCKAIGLDGGLMSRFMAGKSGLSVQTIDAIGKLLSIKLVAGKARRTVKRGERHT